jgi:hypothetical protein
MRCGGVVCIASSYGLDNDNFNVSISSGLALGSTQLPIQWVPGAFSQGRGMKLTTHLQLVPRSRKRGAIHLLSHTPSWRSVKLVKHSDNLNFYFNVTNFTPRHNIPFSLPSTSRRVMVEVF